MIVDSSALVAIVRGEPEAEDFARLIEESGSAQVSTATVLECAIVLGGLRATALDRLVAALELTVVPFDEGQSRLAREAHARFGRGSGSPARLNMGDCFSYALARQTGRPLLFKGDDFTHTDLVAAYHG